MVFNDGNNEGCWMSVLIKGMGMPFSCTECPLATTESKYEYLDEDSLKFIQLYSCYYKPDDVEDGWIRHSVADRKRQDWCPLVEVEE